MQTVRSGHNQPWQPVLLRGSSCVLANRSLWNAWVLLAVFFCGAGRASDAIIVRPSAWKGAVQTWKAHRASQGLQVVELDSELGREGIHRSIRELHRKYPDRLRFVLLAGDVGPHPGICIPTYYRQSSAMVQFGGDASIATDNPYADVNDDDIPDLAVGRIPADSAQQLAEALQRVVDYERNRDFSAWRRAVHVVAGVGGFGILADSVIEMTTRRFLADRIPGWSVVSMTQANLKSQYCPDPYRFSEACIDRFNAGGMFWVYIGHGHVRTLDYLHTAEDALPILTCDHVPAVQTGLNSPIAVFLACYTGAFDASQDSLAEELILKTQGPVAAIAASRVSGPYGLSMLAHGLLENCYLHRRSTLGEIILRAKSQMLQPEGVADSPQGTNAAPAAQQLKMISAIASALSPQDYDLRQERLEHVWQVNLLGDPMLRLNYPQELQLDAPRAARPGERISIRGASQEPGKLTVEFAFRRDQVRRELSQPIVDGTTLMGREKWHKRYELANDRIIVCSDGVCRAGVFDEQMVIPHDLPRGRYCIRAFIEGEQHWQVGYREISIREPRLAP